MSVAILLRLMAGSRTGGRMAGQAEIVDTGEVSTFRDSDEMLALLQRASDATAGAADPSATPPAPDPVAGSQP